MATDNPDELASSSSVDKQHTAPGETPSGPAYPYSPLAGRSVVQALAPHSTPTRAFWTGLFMVLAGLVLVACPLLLGAALVVAQGAQGSTQLAVGALGLSSCFALVILLPGIALIMVGRARR